MCSSENFAGLSVPPLAFPAPFRRFPEPAARALPREGSARFALNFGGRDSGLRCEGISIMLSTSGGGTCPEGTFYASVGSSARDSPYLGPLGPGGASPHVPIVSERASTRLSMFYALLGLPRGALCFAPRELVRGADFFTLRGSARVAACFASPASACGSSHVAARISGPRFCCEGAPGFRTLGATAAGWGGFGSFHVLVLRLVLCVACVAGAIHELYLSVPCIAGSCGARNNHGLTLP